MTTNCLPGILICCNQSVRLSLSLSLSVSSMRLEHYYSCVSVSAGGDQGVLNSFFDTWATADISKHLPFIYNLSSIAIYSYLPAFKQSVHTHTHTHTHAHNRCLRGSQSSL